jgi:hypothetical protein
LPDLYPPPSPKVAPAELLPPEPLESSSTALVTPPPALAVVTKPTAAGGEGGKGGKEEEEEEEGEEMSLEEALALRSSKLELKYIRFLYEAYEPQ